VAARRELDERRPALQAEIHRHEAERRRLDAERRSVADAVARGGSEVPALVERLREAERAIGNFAVRADELRRELEGMESRSIDPEDLRRTLSSFDAIWDALWPRERERVVRLLVERVTFDGRTGDVEIRFHPTGIRELVVEAGASARESA